VYNAGLPDEMHAVREVSVEIAAGEVAVLAGPSGSGKTSLLTLLGCMARPSSGTVTVRDRNVSKLPERFLTEVRRRTFGFVFQQFHLVRDISVLENVLLPLYPLDMGFGPMRSRAAEVLESLHLSGKARVKAGRLSGGEQQRVAIARALINDPDVIIADEPTAHLDSELSGEFLEILSDLNGAGKTVVIASHDPMVIGHPMVLHKVFMRDGRVERTETP
jgi:putative ABC transport system ATP-binding protein